MISRRKAGLVLDHDGNAAWADRTADSTSEVLAEEQAYSSLPVAGFITEKVVDDMTGLLFRMRGTVEDSEVGSSVVAVAIVVVVVDVGSIVVSFVLSLSTL